MTKPDRFDDFTIGALARIYAAARSLERGEENPREAAQDIQRMLINLADGREVFEWTFAPSEWFVAHLRLGFQPDEPFAEPDDLS